MVINVNTTDLSQRLSANPPTTIEAIKNPNKYPPVGPNKNKN